MTKQIKMWVGIALVGTAIYLVYTKSKKPKDPVCAADEELVDAPCPQCETAPCPCPKTKICRAKPVNTPQPMRPMGTAMEDVQSFAGFAGY